MIVCQPEYMEALNKLIETTPIEDLRYYLASQYLNAAAPYLDDNFYAASFDFYGRTMSGKQEPRPRWKRAMAIPNSALGEAVGEMYVEKFFPAEDKARMMTLVENLRTALGQHIDQLDWMSDSTKMRAREKLAAFRVKSATPTSGRTTPRSKSIRPSPTGRISSVPANGRPAMRLPKRINPSIPKSGT